MSAVDHRRDPADFRAGPRNSKIKVLASHRRLALWTPARVDRRVLRSDAKDIGKQRFGAEPHQTPLEFAYAVGMPEAVNVTEKYNRVRFGEKDLSLAESDQIENWLKDISTARDAETQKRAIDSCSLCLAVKDYEESWFCQSRMSKEPRR